MNIWIPFLNLEYEDEPDDYFVTDEFEVDEEGEKENESLLDT